MKYLLAATLALIFVGLVYAGRPQGQPLLIRGQSTVNGVLQPAINGSLNDMHVYRSPVTGYWYLRVEYTNGVTHEEHFDQIHALLGLKLEK